MCLPFDGMHQGLLKRAMPWYAITLSRTQSPLHTRTRTGPVHDCVLHTLAPTIKPCEGVTCRPSLYEYPHKCPFPLPRNRIPYSLVDFELLTRLRHFY
eukprot:scaffold379379_cov38-Prasinocladus_malaysianus.AAC.1